MAGGVGYDGFLLQRRVVAQENRLFGVEFDDLEIVYCRDVEEGGLEFGFGGEAGLVDVLTGGFEFVGNFGYAEAAAEELPNVFLALT